MTVYHAHRPHIEGSDVHIDLFAAGLAGLVPASHATMAKSRAVSVTGSDTSASVPALTPLTPRTASRTTVPSSRVIVTWMFSGSWDAPRMAVTSTWAASLA